MDTLQCAIVLAKLERFEWEVQQRMAIGQRYTDLITSKQTTSLGNVDDKAIQTPTLRSGRTSVYAQYTVMLPNRDVVQKRLADAGIPTAVHYPVPLNEQPAYQHLCCSDCTPVAKKLANLVMSLPMSSDLEHEQQKRIIFSLAT